MSSFIMSTIKPVVVPSRKELHVALRIYSGFTEDTIKRLREILGESIVLSMDSNVLRRAQYWEDVHFVLIAKNASEGSLIEANELLCTIPYPVDEQFGVIRERILHNLVPDKLAVNIDEVKLWFLGFLTGHSLDNKPKFVKDSLKQGRLVARIISADLVARLPNSILPKILKSFWKPLSVHRRIMASNKPMVAYAKMLLDMLMNSTDESISHQLYGVVLMMCGEFWSLKSIKWAKCHCFSMFIATPMIHSLCHAPHRVTIDYDAVIPYAYYCLPNETFDTIKHPHFCAHCGVFESASTKLKTCSKCKKDELLTRFLLCSFQCQIASWPYHKWLHRMPKIKI